MAENAPTLEVGITIDPSSALAGIDQVEEALDRGTMAVLADVAKMEKATGGMFNLSGATNRALGFGEVVTASTKRVENAGEKLVRQLERQIATYGRTSDEIQRMKVEAGALAAEGKGLTELAARLRATSDAFDAMRGPANQLEPVLRKGNFALRQTAMQLPDIFQGLLTGQKPMQVFLQQGGQIAQIGMMAEGGLAGFAASLGGLALAFSPVIIAAGMGVGAFKLFQAQVRDSGELTRYRDSLGLTHKEMLQLSDGVDKAGGKIEHLTGVTITAGDAMAGLWKAMGDGAEVGGLWDKMKGGAATAFEYVLKAWNAASAGITAGIYGTFGAVQTIWSTFPSVFGDLFVQGVNAAIGALNRLVKTGVDQINGLLASASKIPGINLGQISAPQISLIDNANAGAAARAAAAIGDGYRKAYSDARAADTVFWRQVGENSKQHAKDRLLAEADAIKANRTPKKENDHGLGNALAELDAQIKGQMLLAAAYEVSDAAAMKAEAHQKAEQQAIQHKGDTALFYEKELALAAATTLAAGAKHIADLNAQAAMQKQVNDAVAAGALPASQMSQALQAAGDKRQMQAALVIAQENGWLDQVVKLTAGIANLGRVQADANAEANRAQVLASTATGADQIARLRLEARLIGATNEARAIAIAQLEAEQFLRTHPGASGAEAQRYIDQQREIAKLTADNAAAQSQLNEELRTTAALADSLADSMSRTFGRVGGALGDVVKILGDYGTKQSAIDEQVRANTMKVADARKLSGDLQISSLVGITDAAKGLFREHSAGYRAMQDAERALTIVQLARTAVDVAGGAARMFATLGPFAFPAVAAMVGVMASLGFSGGGGGAGKAPQSNTGTGTVLGDSSAKSESIKNALDQLKGIDDATLSVSRDMLASLRFIEGSIGGLASLVVRTGSIDATMGVKEGFKSAISDGMMGAYRTAVGFAVGGPLGAAIGAFATKIPVIGDLIGGLGGVVQSLFGTKKKITASGLYGDAQSVGDILGGGFDLSNYADIKKTKKFLGISAGSSYSTKYAEADAGVEDQFGLLIRQFYTTIGKAAGPLGIATEAVEDRLKGFVVDLGKIDLKGLSGSEIEEKLQAVFGAAADRMADAAIPGLDRFQKVGEGAFQTLVRVASTVEQVDATFRKLGVSSSGLGVDIDMAISGLFDSVSDFTSAAGTYFDRFYSDAEKQAANAAEISRALGSLGLAMPSTMAAYRQLVEAQDLTSEAGQRTYAALLQLSPAFADLQQAMNGAKSAADVLSERLGLEKTLLQLQGDTAELRRREVEALDPANRALQLQIYALEDQQAAAKVAADDAQAAADAAKQLASAWASIGDGIMNEVRRIRGLTDVGGGSFAQLLGQFNDATALARAGDQEAGRLLPGLSKSLLDAAELSATSRQEVDRVQAQAAASLEETYRLITTGLFAVNDDEPVSTGWAAAAAAQPTATATVTMDDLVAEVRSLRAELAGLRGDNNAGNAAIANGVGRSAKVLENVSGKSGGDAIATIAA